MIFMKKIVLSLLGCILSFQCFASSVSEMDGKLYVTPGSVYVALDAIYVNLDGNFVPVNSVKVDENGVYVEGLETACMVYCAGCGRTYDREKYTVRCPHDKRKYR